MAWQFSTQLGYIWPTLLYVVSCLNIGWDLVREQSRVLILLSTFTSTFAVTSLICEKTHLRNGANAEAFRTTAAEEAATD